MNSSLSHYRQFPLLGKHLFPGTSAFSALEKLSYQIQISACLNSHPGSGLKGFQDTGGQTSRMALVLSTSSRNTELKAVPVTTPRGHQVYIAPQRNGTRERPNLHKNKQET